MPADEKEIAALEREAAVQGFWDVPETAQRKMQRLSDLKGKVEDWQTLETQAASLEELLLLSIEEEDDSLLDTLRSGTRADKG